MHTENHTPRLLPPLLTMKDGRTCTEELWPERRLELLDILQEHLYGYTPDAPPHVHGTIVHMDEKACAGKVVYQTIEIAFDTPGGPFTFPLHLFVPRSERPAPLFLHIAFRPDLPDRYTPVEEICDGGFALAVMCYNDVTPDSLHGNFDEGLAAKYITDSKRAPAEWGKIGLWAFAASRALDYLLTRDDIDHDHIAVAGHSRLGKTALWCAAQDERVTLAVSNNSGFGGAALAKDGQGEKVADFLRVGSYDWFCENYLQNIGRENELPYDQHYLLAAIAPRYLCVGSAVEDRGADPESEYWSCVAATEVYNLLGYDGLIGGTDGLPDPGTHYAEGRIGYHLRSGTHYFSRYDWQRYMAFFRAKIEER